MTIYEIINKISNGGMDELFSQVYSESDSEILRQRARYLNCAENFSRLYPLHEEIHIFSVPGRVEIGGNHTAQQHGNVLAAAVTPDILGFVAYHNENVVRIFSKDFEHVEIDLSDLSDIAEKYSGYGALTAEIISEFAAKGIICSGFDAYIMSDIPVESGFFSSVAFEIFIGNIINNSSDKRLSEIEIAKIGHFVEQKYMEKEIGLESYLICAIGGIAAFELNYPHNPVIRRLDFDFSKSGYSVCLVDVGENNENFTDTYKEILYDMKSVANAIGVEYLGEADEDAFFDNIAEIRKKCCDRAVNRAIYFFEENKRVFLEVEAVEGGRIHEFLELVNLSGKSFAIMLQNMQPSLKLALSISRRYLNGSGAVRVHGGYVISFVPDYMVGNYIKTLDNIFGQGSTKAMKFRKGAAGELYV
ncbi:MAG: galactokinase [Ruminococcus sp.]|nr:galactokinase [Ruminococcus sp.]